MPRASYPSSSVAFVPVATQVDLHTVYPLSMVAFDSESTYATHRKKLLEVARNLQVFGTSSQTYISIPKVAAIGNQSSGKSSILSSITGVLFPRCTRCPIECRMMESPDEWKAQILLRFEYDVSGKALDKVYEMPFGIPITNPEEVPFALQRAQAAVLYHPSVPSSETILEAKTQEELDALLKETKPLPFSRNVVCLNLEGPEFTDLSFIDLPGLVHNAEPTVVQLVEEVVNHYISGNSIILVVIPMTDSIQNQKALQLVLNKDPDGQRTIGVLTKPDMLISSKKSASMWLEVLQGRRHPLQHGYFCCRQPNDDQRSANITTSEARKIEDAFFMETEPWSTSKLQEKFGVKNLVAKLGHHLFNVINDKLPEIRASVAEQREQCRERLNEIPNPVSDSPVTYFYTCLTEFCTELQPFIQGGPGTARLIHANRRAFEEFDNAIEETAPFFIPYAANEQGPRFVNSLEEESDGPAVVSRGLSMNVSQMRAHIAQSVLRELPGNVPFDAKSVLILRFQEMWPANVKECFNKVEAAMLELLMEKIDSNFGRFNLLQVQMRTLVKDFVRQLRETCNVSLNRFMMSARDPFILKSALLKSHTNKWMVKYISLREACIPTTGEVETNSSGDTSKSKHTESGDATSAPPFSFTSIKTTPSFDILARSSPSPSGSFLRPTPPPAPSLVDTSSQSCTSPEIPYPDTSHRQPRLEDVPGNYETELLVMAEVRAYFQLASFAFTQTIPPFIDSHFVKALDRELQQYIMRQFKTDTPEAHNWLGKLLAENPMLVARRQELLARIGRLERLERELDELDISLSCR